MAFKIKQDGKVKDLIIPACGVQILDMEDNFESSNLEEVLQEIGEGESVYISDKEPDKDGIWISSDNTSTAGENPTLVALKEYVDKKLGTTELTTDDKTIKGAINEHQTQIKENSEQLKDLRNEVTQLSNPNLLINGDFSVWQRGTSFSLSAAGYSADRWLKARTTFQSIEKTSTGGLKVNITGATTNGSGIIQTIEGASRLLNKNFTLSMKYKSNINIQIRLANSDYTKTYAVVRNDGKTNEWHTMSCTGVIDSVTNDIVRVEISCPSTQDGEFEIEWAKLELGTVATPFVSRGYGEELALCKRYYEVILSGANDIAIPICEMFTNGQQVPIMGADIAYQVEKRIPPSLQLSKGNNNACGRIVGRYYPVSQTHFSIPVTNISIFGVDKRRCEFLLNFDTGAETKFPTTPCFMTYDTLGVDSQFFIALDAEIY